MQRGRCSALNGMSLSHPSVKVQGSMWKGGKKNSNSQRWTILWNSIFQTAEERACMNSQRWWQQVQDFKQAQGWQKTQHKRGGAGTVLAKKLLKINSLWARKVSFLRWSDTGCINHSPGQAPCSGVDGEHNDTLWFYDFFSLIFKRDNTKMGG